MQGNIEISIFYCLSMIIAFGLIMAFPKSKKKINGTSWIVISLLALWCIQAILAGIVSIFGVKINILTLGIMLICLSVGMLLYIYKKREIQKYQWYKYDILAMLVIAAVVGVIFLKIYGFGIGFVFKNSDGAVHLGNALSLVRGETVFGMYFASLFSAAIIEVFQPFLKITEYYKAFVLADGAALLLEALMFFILIRDYLKNKWTKMIGVGAGILYLCGYPLMSYLSNFYYWGIAVMIMGLFLLSVRYFKSGEIERRWSVWLMMFAGSGVFLCYMLITPVVYIASFLALSSILRKEGKFFTLTNVKTALQIYLLPCLLGLYYCYFQWLWQSGTEVAGTLATNGGIYSELYVNFLWLMPLALYMLLKGIKKRNVDENMIFLLTFIFFVVILFFACYIGKISPYYYYKFYYPLWMLLWIAAVQGACHIWEEQKEILISGLVVVAFVFGLFGLRLEEKIMQGGNATSYITPANRSNELLSIYWHNLQCWSPVSLYDARILELCDFVLEDEQEREAWLIADIGTYYYTYMFDSITGQNSSPVYGWYYSIDEIKDTVMQGEEKYILVLYQSEIYQENQEFFESFHKKMENELGCVLEVGGQ